MTLSISQYSKLLTHQATPLHLLPIFVVIRVGIISIMPGDTISNVGDGRARPTTQFGKNKKED